MLIKKVDFFYESVIKMLYKHTLCMYNDVRDRDRSVLSRWTSAHHFPPYHIFLTKSNLHRVQIAFCYFIKYTKNIIMKRHKTYRNSIAKEYVQP